MYVTLADSVRTEIGNRKLKQTQIDTTKPNELLGELNDRGRYKIEIFEPTRKRTEVVDSLKGECGLQSFPSLYAPCRPMLSRAAPPPRHLQTHQFSRCQLCWMHAGSSRISILFPISNLKQDSNKIIYRPGWHWGWQHKTPVG